MAEETLISWSDVHDVIGMMARRWCPGTRDELAIWPPVAVFAKAMLDDLEARGCQRPMLLPEDHGGLSLVFDEVGGRRYISIGMEELGEGIVRPNGWTEVSYAEVAPPLSV